MQHQIGDQEAVMRKPSLTIRATGIGLLLSGVLGQAQATTSTATMSITSSVQATCIVSTTSLDFGTYTGQALNSTSTITVTCTNSTTYNIGIDHGLHSSTLHKMIGPTGNTFTYGVYTDSARSVAWGNTVGTDTVSSTGNGSAQAFTVYGLLSGNVYVAPGAYTDTLTVTVTY